MWLCILIGYCFWQLDLEIDSNLLCLGITNRYAFFNVDDDVDIDDPTEALTQVQNEKKAKKEAAKASQVNKPPAPRKDLKKDDNGKYDFC